VPTRDQKISRWSSSTEDATRSHDRSIGDATHNSPAPFSKPKADTGSARTRKPSIAGHMRSVAAIAASPGVATNQGSIALNLRLPSQKAGVARWRDPHAVRVAGC
jgi:hypothetical protein